MHAMRGTIATIILANVPGWEREFSMDTHAFSEVLLDLYRTAQTSNPVKFPEYLLRVVNQHVGFDTAMMGVISTGAADYFKLYSVHLHNETAACLSEWVQLSTQDILLESTLATRGRARSIELNELALHPVLHDFASRHKHLHMLGLVANYTSASAQFGMSIRRSDRKRHFSTSEERVLERLMPHMIEAYRINRTLFGKKLLTSAVETYRGSCVFDGAGVIHYSSEEFLQLGMAIFRNFDFIRVPAPLQRAHIQQRRTRLIEKNFVFDCQKVGHLYFLQAHLGNPLDALSPRELGVAKSYSAGLSYKEIAAELIISPATARRHIESIYAKLNICNKSDLTIQVQAHAGDNDIRHLLKHFEPA